MCYRAVRAVGSVIALNNGVVAVGALVLGAVAVRAVADVIIGACVYFAVGAVLSKQMPLLCSVATKAGQNGGLVRYF